MAGADQRPHHPGLQLAVFPHPCKPCPEKRGDALQPGAAGEWPLQDRQLLQRRRLVHRWCLGAEGLLHPVGHPVLRPAVLQICRRHRPAARRPLPPARPAVCTAVRLLVRCQWRGPALWPQPDLPLCPEQLLGGLHLGRAGAAAPAGDEGTHCPQFPVVAEPENVRPGRHPHHRLLLPADVHGRAVQRPRQPLLGHEELFAACFAGRPPLLVCRSRAHARIGAAQAHAIRQYAGAAPGGAGNGLCRRCQRGPRARTVPGKVRKICLRYPLWLLRFPQPGGARSGRTGQYAGFCHRRQRICAQGEQNVEN